MMMCMMFYDFFIENFDIADRGLAYDTNKLTDDEDSELTEAKLL
jgi:hypothetical protein